MKPVFVMSGHRMCNTDSKSTWITQHELPVLIGAYVKTSGLLDFNVRSGYLITEIMLVITPNLYVPAFRAKTYQNWYFK